MKKWSIITVVVWLFAIAAVTTAVVRSDQSIEYTVQGFTGSAHDVWNQAYGNTVPVPQDMPDNADAFYRAHEDLNLCKIYIRVEDVETKWEDLPPIDIRMVEELLNRCSKYLTYKNSLVPTQRNI